MTTWFLCKIKYLGKDQQGTSKVLTEYYLFEAYSYTDAEASLFSYFEGSNLAEFEVATISKMNLSEVFLDETEDNWWFKVKVQFFVFDEKTKKEKKVPQLMLINAKDLKQAFDKTKERLGNLDDFVISDINVTKIEEVIPMSSTGQLKEELIDEYQSQDNPNEKSQEEEV